MVIALARHGINVKFEELNNTIPYAMGGKAKALSMQPYPNITLLMPGRHAKQTTPKGGDFVVCVDDIIFGTGHQFKHNDIFDDVEVRQVSSAIRLDDVMRAYLDVIAFEADIPSFGSHGVPAMNPETFLQAVQCLAVAEHRRYAEYEKQFGGRYLPFRFAAGIAEGLWNAEEASWLEKKGRPGVEQLERERGVPILTKELFDSAKA